MHRCRAPLALALVLVLGVLGACTPAPTPGVAAGPGNSAETLEAREGAASGPVADPPADAVAPPSLHPRVDGLPATAVRILRASGGGPATVAVRVAETLSARRQGLMGVPELPDGTGMLFVFAAARSGGFWMRDTLVALDIAFVGEDRRIAAILTMEPCVADPCPVYDPDVAYRWALEVPAGWFARQQVRRGDEVSWDPPAAPGGQ